MMWPTNCSNTLLAYTDRTVATHLKVYGERLCGIPCVCGLNSSILRRIDTSFRTNLSKMKFHI